MLKNVTIENFKTYVKYFINFSTHPTLFAYVSSSTMQQLKKILNLKVDEECGKPYPKVPFALTLLPIKRAHFDQGNFLIFCVDNVLT